MGGKCCKEGSGWCRCNFRHSQGTCGNCCVCCRPHPESESLRAFPEDEAGWATACSQTNAFLDQFGFTRIVPLDNEGRRDSVSDHRSPFIAHLTIVLPLEKNAWLNEHPDEMYLSLSTDGGADKQMVYENRQGFQVDPTGTEFHFVIDRSFTTLRVTLRNEPCISCVKLPCCVCGDGHKMHEVPLIVSQLITTRTVLACTGGHDPLCLQWRIMVDGSSPGAAAEGADAEGAEAEGAVAEGAEAEAGDRSLMPNDSIALHGINLESNCSEVSVEAANYGATITPGTTTVHLEPAPGTYHKTKNDTGNVCLVATYEHIRGAPDGGNVTGPGYVACNDGNGSMRPVHVISDHWVCTHDNVVVMKDTLSGADTMFDHIAGKIGIKLNRDAIAKDAYKGTGINLESNWRTSSDEAREHLLQRYVSFEEQPGETTDTAVLRQTVGELLAFLNARTSELEYRSMSSLRADVPTITGEWQSGSSQLGQTAALVVPVDQWHTSMKPAKVTKDDGELVSGDDPFWSTMQQNVTTIESRRKEGGQFTEPLPLTATKHPGLYTVRMMRDDGQYGMGNIFYLKPGTQCVVFDCDGTLTVGDQEVVTQFLFTANYDPRRFNAAATMVRSWAAKGYQPVYVSGRQGTMYNWTLSWLVKHGFPPGPIHLTRTMMPTLPIYSSVGVFKVNYMKSLVDQGLEIYAAYGNTGTDIKAYDEVNVPKERTWIIGPHTGGEDTPVVAYEDNNGYHSHIKTVWEHPDANVPIPYVSLDWGAPFWGYDK